MKVAVVGVIACHDDAGRLRGVRSKQITASYTSTVAPLWDKHPKILGGNIGHAEGAGTCLLIEA